MAYQLEFTPYSPGGASLVPMAPGVGAAGFTPEKFGSIVAAGKARKLML